MANIVAVKDEHFFANVRFQLDYYKCPNCSDETGPDITPKYRYCPYCGIKLSWELQKNSKDGVIEEI